MYLDEDWDLSQIDEGHARGVRPPLLVSLARHSRGERSGSSIVLELIDGVPHFVSNRETNGWDYPDEADRDQIDLGPVVTGR